MAAQKDFYEILGVSRSASQDELKKAFRKQAMRFHPDRNPGDEEAEQKFKEINAAYEILKDEDKRAAYDRYGHAAFEGGMGGGAGGGFGGFGGFDAGGLGDIFEQMFGGMGGRSRNTRSKTGNDVQANITITLEEAFSGIKKTVTTATRKNCSSCEGTGSSDKNNGRKTCETCHGHGVVRAQQGFFMVERPCPTCQGNGEIVKNPCKKCRGKGTEAVSEEISIDIPAGIEDGTRIRVSGKGEAGGKNIPNGDLYVLISISQHEIFQRDGSTIYCRIPLRMTQAALGTEIEVPLIDGGRAKVKIPAGTQTGETFRLRGKGFSVLHSHARGDMYLKLSLETPNHLTKKQRELLEEFEKEMEDHSKASPESSGFWSRVQDFFTNGS